jgi:ribosome-associated translation inhibitor RaiA
MSRLDFHIEFYGEKTTISDALKDEAESRLRTLAADRTDMIGASIAVEELTQDETPHMYRARVVVYIRPENIVAVEQAGALDGALKGALEAAERQVRQRREKFKTQWQPTQKGSDTSVYQLSTRELFDTYVGQLDVTKVLNRSRIDIATELMANEGLDQEAAYYAADEILVFAQEAVDLSKSAAPDETSGGTQGRSR